jgi:hypothetical protein
MSPTYMLQKSKGLLFILESYSDLPNDFDAYSHGVFISSRHQVYMIV